MKILRFDSGYSILGGMIMLNGFVCPNCLSYFTEAHQHCQHCNSPLTYDGEQKNVIDHLNPNCLIHRYDGSDMLEPAVLLKPGKVNAKVATKLSEYAKPLVVPKSKIYTFQHDVFCAIQSVRSERSATMKRYDYQIASHWQKLKPYEL
jgi:hypothetical protein